MFRTAFEYLKDEVRPRWREIATEPEWLVAIAIGVCGAYWGNRLALGDSQVGDVVTVVLAYAAVAFGFCLAGLTVAMTLPDPRFAVELAKMEIDSPRPTGETAGGAEHAAPPRPVSWRRRKPAGFVENAYGKLLFVFSWTAFVHWLVIVTAFTLLIARGYDTPLIADSAPCWARGLVGLMATFLAYAGMQFLVTLITLSQVGSVYVTQLRKRD